MVERKIRDNNENILHLYIWNKVDNPIGVIQIVHGINEHGLRYCNFAEYLNKNGYIVYLHDQLSQGNSRRKEENVVYFGKNGINNLKVGVDSVYNEIKTDYPDLNIYAIGHSLGSSVLRSCLIDNNLKYRKVVLNGTGLTSTRGMGIIIIIGRFLKLFGAKKPSKFFDNIFRSTQLKLREKVEMSHFIEWLTRDKKQNEIDKSDKYLYIRLSVSVFVDMIKLFKHVNKKQNIVKISKDNTILLISGTHDPATNYGDETKALHELMNLYHIESKLYLIDEGRHDSFQEINKIEIYNEVIKFLNNKKGVKT
ncbi:MAG: alpha/beta hydrolase [Acholeplasmataceae bacterium]|nr:alpha/beta hydrolase [Acholeplasmataceae bacterium]